MSIKIKHLVFSGHIEYEGKEYPFKSFVASLDGEKELADIAFAGESLSKAVLDEFDMPRDRECEYIDNSIYGYLPDEQFALPTDEIIKVIENTFD